jgi:hypothetical protein
MQLEIRGLDENLHVAPRVARENVRAADGGSHEGGEQQQKGGGGVAQALS